MLALPRLRRRSVWGRDATRCAPGENTGPSERYVLPAVILLLALLVLPSLPPGVCFDDSGDLQAASRYLGIAHPPGYVGFATIGWLLTRIPGVDPAHMVTLACAASGLAALALCGRLSVRLGAEPLVAASIVVLLALHPSIRDNLFAPEVYAPTLALLVGAMVCLAGFVRTGRARWAAIGAFLLGCAMGSRTPAVLLAPGFLAGLWLACRRKGFARRATARTLGIALALASVPCLYTCAYLWLRDSPANLYNHVDLERTTSNPPSPKAGQILRFLSGAGQLRSALRLNWPALRERADWILRHCLPNGPIWLAILLPVSAVGFVRITRRTPEMAWVLGGVAGGSLLLLLLFHTEGTAADYSPLAVTVAVCCGVALSPARPDPLAEAHLAARYTVFVAACLWAAVGLFERPPIAAEVDASAFLARANVPTLPADAIILAPWSESTALRYACAACGRKDIRVLLAAPERFSSLGASVLADPAVRDRPVYAIRATSTAPGIELADLRSTEEADAGRKPR
jgi:hypothetical protein